MSLEMSGQPAVAAGRRRPLYSLAWYLVPPVAGIALGVGAYAVWCDDRAFLSLWHGGSIDPESIPDPWLLRGAGVAIATAVWVFAAQLLRGEGRLADGLRLAAPGFSGFLAILALNAVASYTGYELTYFSALAGVYGFAFFAAWLVAASLRTGEGKLWRLHEGIAKHAALIVAAAGIGYFALSWTLSMLQYRAVRISYHDCAGFDEMLWKTLHGQFMRASVWERSFLGQHFEFIHLLLLPVYVLWPGLPILMLTQSAGLASGVIPIYLLSKRKLGSRFVAVCFCVAYLFYAPMQYADKRLIYEIYLPETLAIPALLWVLYFLECGNMWGLLTAGFLAAACKEDMAMPVAMTGLVLIARRKWRWGFAIFVGGWTWFVASLLVIIPYFEGGQSHVMSYFSEMGGSARGVIATVFGNPIETLRHAFAFQRIDFMLMMLVPMGMLALLSPMTLLIFLPSIASNSLATWPPSARIVYHYHIALVPFAVGGAIFGAANLVKFLERKSLLWTGVPRSLRAGLVAVFAGVMVLAASAAGDVLYGKFPLSLNFYNPKSPAYWRHIYVQAPRAKFFVEKVLPTIPKDARVCASQYLATRFTHRATDYTYPNTPRGVERADYIVIEIDEPVNPSTVYSVSPVCEGEPFFPSFECILKEQGIYVFKRTDPRWEG